MRELNRKIDNDVKQKNIDIAACPSVEARFEANGNSITIYDIAKRVGKSPSTVSRALNGCKTVSAGTIKEISEVAASMGYVVNCYAKNLRTEGGNASGEEDTAVTIYDIAKKLHISAATVSRAFSNKSSIKPSTKAKIIKKAVEMGFIVHENARQLRTKRFDSIGVFLTCLNKQSVGTLLAGIKEVADQMGFNLLITDTQTDSFGAVQRNQKLVYENCDGLIIIPMSFRLDKGFFETLRRLKPVICLGSQVKNKLITNIAIDHFEVVYRLTAHLIGCGCKNILYADAQRGGKCYKERLAGYIKAFESDAMVCDKSYYDDDALSQMTITSKISECLPDGVLIVGDHNQISQRKFMLKSLLAKNPGLLFAVFDTDLPDQEEELSMTNVQVDYYETGKMLSRQIIDQIRFGRSKYMSSVLLPYRLIFSEVLVSG